MENYGFKFKELFNREAYKVDFQQGEIFVVNLILQGKISINKVEVAAYVVFICNPVRGVCGIDFDTCKNRYRGR